MCPQDTADRSKSQCCAISNTLTPHIWCLPHTGWFSFTGYINDLLEETNLPLINIPSKICTLWYIVYGIYQLLHIIRVSVYWGTWLYCDYFSWCVFCTVVVLTCFVMCGCVCMCVCVDFAMCENFGNMCTCIYCVLCCFYCVFILFRLCELFVLSVLV